MGGEKDATEEVYNWNESEGKWEPAEDATPTEEVYNWNESEGKWEPADQR